MHILLLLIGLIGALAGASALAFGLINPAFRLDPVVSAAVPGLAGGLILIGLGAVLRQLRRIADALEVQPMTRDLTSMSEPRAPEAAAAGTSAVAAALELDPEPPAETEPRVEPEPSVTPEPPVRSPVAPPEPPPAAPEPPAIPASAPVPVVPPPLPASDPGRAAAPPVRSPVAPPEPLRGTDRLPAAAPLPGSKSAEWPHVALSDRVAPPLSSKPPALAATPVAPERSAPPVELPVTDKPRVLKSGVIEGMPYTLYSDGSVDAELPTGTTRFASISAWRAHLREGA